MIIHRFICGYYIVFEENKTLIAAYFAENEIYLFIKNVAGFQMAE